MTVDRLLYESFTRPLAERIASQRSVSSAEFPAWWAAYWRERADYEPVEPHSPARVHADPSPSFQSLAEGMRWLRQHHPSVFLHPEPFDRPSPFVHHINPFDGHCMACGMTKMEIADFPDIDCQHACEVQMPVDDLFNSDRLLAGQRYVMLHGLQFLGRRQRQSAAQGHEKAAILDAKEAAARGEPEPDSIPGSLAAARERMGHE